MAIPTTSGTGSEVTSFAVITNKENNIKYPLADYELTPDVAIIDSQFVRSLPREVIADTGLDVLTHGIEAYVSVMATAYTDALALKAIKWYLNIYQNLIKMMILQSVWKLEKKCIMLHVWLEWLLLMHF